MGLRDKNNFATQVLNLSLWGRSSLTVSLFLSVIILTSLILGFFIFYCGKINVI